MKDLQFNEKKQHGLPDFPFQYYYIDSSHPQYIMPLHWHGEFEIIRVLSGEFQLFLDNKSMILKSGEAALIGCALMHRGIPRNAVYECVVFNLSMLYKKSNDIVRKFIRPISHSRVYVQSCPDANSLDIINEIFEVSVQNNDFMALHIHSLLFELIYSLYSNKVISQAEKPKNEKQLSIVIELMDWIDSNISENISLSKLSEISGMNEKYLCRFFKDYTGKTPIDYVNYLRIEAACQELDNGHLSITEAALECGFNSISYFTKTFKKYKGISPREYLKISKQSKT
ncbi:MAG: AraC family transcriptional regulator [Acutalibacteraceae bacterium]|nr:AraC family transcriptional regulator [Acutalibacteraceae bacterium]